MILNHLLYVCQDDTRMICNIDLILQGMIMKKFFIATLCALSLFATCTFILNESAKPVVAGGSGYGVMIR